MTDTYNLAVNFSNLELNAPIVRARIEIRRSYLVDTFVVVPELKMDVVVDGEDFEVPLIPNTYGSFYEIVLWSEHTEELRCFFIMPAADTQLQNLELLTAYPNQLSGSSEPEGAHRFTDLYDTPNNYNDDAGKLVVVRNDQTGLEFRDGLEATRVTLQSGHTVQQKTVLVDQIIEVLGDRITVTEQDIIAIEAILSRDFIEIVAGTNSAYLGLDIGGYVTRRPFTIKSSYPHIGAHDINQQLVVTLYKLQLNGDEQIIGTVTYLNKVASFNFINEETNFAEGDVLRAVITTYPANCNRINLTLIARFAPYELV